jgi:malonate transporter MadM subunit
MFFSYSTFYEACQKAKPIGMNIVNKLLINNGLILAFLITGLLMFFASIVSEKILNKKIPGSAIAILCGLCIAYIGGKITGGKNGIADLKIFSGFSILGGAMFRDFTIVATAMGASFKEMRRTGVAGFLSLFTGVILSFFVGSIVAIGMGYHDAISISTIGAGACTFLVGPITGGAIGASSEVIVISIAAGVVKSVLVTIVTPLIASVIKLNNPQSAMVYGGLMGTTSGVAAGLAATDPELVPYGAMTATFYTGLGCLLCPSVLFFFVKLFFH